MPETQSPVKSREYETIYILKPDVTRDAQEKIATRLNEVLARESGKLTLIENWGRRPLAYPVAKQRRGVYVYLKYLGGGVLVSEIERNLRMLDDVVKYQTVLTNADVDAGTVSVSDEDLKFEAVEPPAEGEEVEESIERRLGLIEGERMRRDDVEYDPEDEYGGNEVTNDVPGTEAES
jgi:small subunit ribosomal protein S6